MTAEICLCKDSKGIRPALYGWSLGKKSARKPKHHHLISQWKTYLDFASIFFCLKIGNFGKKTCLSRYRHLPSLKTRFQSSEHTWQKERTDSCNISLKVCVHVPLCVHAHECVYMYLFFFSVCMFVLALCAHVYMYVCMCGYVVSVFTCTCVYRCMFVYGLCVCLWVFVLYVSTCMYTRVCLCWHVFFFKKLFNMYPSLFIPYNKKNLSYRYFSFGKKNVA